MCIAGEETRARALRLRQPPRSASHRKGERQRELIIFIVSLYASNAARRGERKFPSLIDVVFICARRNEITLRDVNSAAEEGEVPARAPDLMRGSL